MPTTDPDAPDSCKSIASQSTDVYEIRIKGVLDDHWRPWFEGMTLKADPYYDDGQGCTIIIGPIADQPALHGILEKIRDLNLTLISVRTLDEGPELAGETAGAPPCKADGNDTP